MIAKVAPGQRFAPSATAESWNAFVDAAQAHRGRLFNTGAEIHIADQDASDVAAYNASGEQRRRGHILGLGAPTVTGESDLPAFAAGPIFKGETPTRTKHQYQFGVLLSDPGVKAGCTLRISGLAICQVDVRALIHPRATIKDDDPTQLESDFWGAAEILTPREQTGKQWVLVRLGAFGGQKVRGKLSTAPLNKGSAGTVKVWTGKGGAAALSSPLVEIKSVFNPFVALTSTDVFVHVVWCNDGPETDAAGC